MPKCDPAPDSDPRNDARKELSPATARIPAAEPKAGDGPAGKPGTAAKKDRPGFSNSLVFSKVMFDNMDLCRELIEAVLDIRIAHVKRAEVEAERPEIEGRGVRLDVLLEGDDTAFNVEMQASHEPCLPQRMRYHHSQIDRLSTARGDQLDDLRSVYVIFICAHDPFGHGLPVYTFRNSCEEDRSVPYDDGAASIVLNARGDLSRTSKPVADLLHYVATGSTRKGELSARIHKAVDEAYRDEEWVSHMITVEWEMENIRRAALKRGHADGLAEGRAEGLAEAEARSTALVAAMQRAGCTDGEIVAALSRPDKTDLYRRYCELTHT